ncbi:unnamed protein product [Clonostachys byssicola]|uniref:Uncharacterized protein n=1 Tax=Clonostachys byssicola TaxID=160290 RepID=A0A9N9UC27_9HYPO|nr:unnamed protein product [Clonostachys byssicola]
MQCVLALSKIKAKAKPAPMKSSVAPVTVFHDSLARTGQSLRRPTQAGSSAKLPETLCASEVRPLINNQVTRFTGVDNQRLMRPLVSITTAWTCLAGFRTGKTMQINPPQAEEHEQAPACHQHPTMVPFGEREQDPELTMLLWKWRREGWTVGQNLLTCHPIRGVNHPSRAPDENDGVDQWWSEAYSVPRPSIREQLRIWPWRAQGLM